jgi:hypothetical protein
MTWTVVLPLAVGSFALKALGPLLLRGGSSTDVLTKVSALLTPALMMALIAVQTFAVERSLQVDARAAGVGVAALAVWRRLPFVAVVVLAAATAAAVRALS